MAVSPSRYNTVYLGSGLSHVQQDVVHLGIDTAPLIRLITQCIKDMGKALLLEGFDGIIPT